jgi:adenylate kinase family enzyme
LKRIAVIGNAGSGKSYVAQRLGAIYGLPVVELDALFWLRPGDYTTKRPLDQLAVLVKSERSRDKWVVEGVFGELVEPFLPTAQQLLWLDFPWSVSLARITARQNERALPTDGESFKALVAYSAAYWQRDDARSHAGHGRMFEGFSGEKRRLTTEDDVNAFLQTASACETA